MNTLVINEGVKVVSQNGQEIPLMYVQISWYLSQPEYNIQTIRDLFQKYNLDETVIPKQTKKTICQRAVNNKKGKKHDKLVSKVIDTNMAKDGTAKLVYEFHDKKVDDSGSDPKLQFESKAIITFNKADNQLYSNDLETEKKIRDLMAEKEQTIPKSKITDILRDLFQDKNPIIKKVSAGNQLIIPAMHYEYVRDVKCMFKELDPKGFFYIDEFAETNQNVETFEISVEGMLDTFESDITERYAELLKKDGVSKTILKNSKDDLMKFLSDMKIPCQMTKNKIERLEMFEKSVMNKIREWEGLSVVKTDEVKEIEEISEEELQEIIKPSEIDTSEVKDDFDNDF